MSIHRATLLVILSAVLSPGLLAMPARILGVDPFTGHYVSCDMTTGNITHELPLSMPGFTINGANGLAEHPVTHELFLIAKVAGVSGRVLGTLDIDTGVITQVGNLGDNFATLAFDGGGTLWGVTGDGAATPETLYTIDTTTAMKTFQRALGNGADGETIVFSPVTGLFYHCSGNGTVIFESIDPVSLTVTPIPIMGATRGEIFGMLWDDAAGLMVLSDIASGFDTMTTAGVFTQTMLSSGTGGMSTSDIRGIVDLATSCGITSPVPGAMVMGDVSIAFDAVSPGNSALDSTFEFSTDAGATWNVATAAASSALSSPDLGQASPISATFVWDSMADGVGMGAPQMVDFRITTTNSLLGSGSCVVTGLMGGGCALCGDCDLNMTGPNILDALAAAQIAVGLFQPSPQAALCCDVDSSAAIAITDALQIAQSAAGLPIIFNCP